jgi:hypothetical protein
MTDEGKPSQERAEEEAREASEARDQEMDIAAEVAAREAIAAEVARAQAERARIQAEQMNVMRQAAQSRAVSAERDAETSRFGFYLLLGVIVAVIVVTGAWLLTRTPQTEAASPAPTVQTAPPAQSPPSTVVVPVPAPSPPVVVEKQAPERAPTVIVTPPPAQQGSQSGGSATKPQTSGGESPTNTGDSAGSDQ